LTATIKKLSDSINKKKEAAHSQARDLRPLRQKAFDLQNEYDKQKSSYDSLAAGLEAALNKIKQEVQKLESELQSLKSSSFKTECDLEVLSAFESLLTTSQKEGEEDLEDQHKIEGGIM
jgi:predicted  nucleic acid-binding Zn-ribbon protein